MGTWVGPKRRDEGGAVTMKADPTTRRRARALRRRLTEAETILWSKLKGLQLEGWHFRKQHPVGPYIGDFACAEHGLIVEVDGATHSSAEERNHDARRTAYLETESWRVLRVHNHEIYSNLYGVLRTIAEALPPRMRR